MRPFGTLLSAALLAVALTSCNTTEALTPQGNVGGGGARTSSPVTQAETDRMARSAQPETYNSNSGYQSGPQSTLEAQARALESGSAVSPSSSGPPPQWEGQGSQGQQQTMQQPQAQQPASAAQQQQSRQQQSASLPPASGPTVRFLPIIGAPVQAVTPLSRQLGAQARANGLTIRPSSDNSTEHILKGYFSAFSDSGKVTIVYVWDILDSSGARLHRMQGQESVPGSGQDPWAAVPASTMETIAAKTIQDYVAWRQSQG
ncbi:hypothetical protein [Neorhizobium galegae]|uniref:Lipoprotein n=2 Tax=Neorhizobium galegae TaxID=399 RepID=A0A068SSC6_NEOGA|nr:hypothetical protein [Neorhizobium galegae]KAB1087430.1 hypothetical protein F4V91_13960 [Neorhizobium galegae]MCQ1850868.1 hypothetical protein [Neorhizobium galegae]CDN48676.1 Hypothetical protein RG540_CH25100 [Neorhizobium galegae bv. orientalis str. HAMBI 540]